MENENLNQTTATQTNKKSRISAVNIANIIIIAATVIAMIMFLIIGFIYLGKNWGNDIQIDKYDPSKTMNSWAFLFLLPVCGLAALAGVVSVAASNNKAPITLLVLSSISTIYKFSYSVVQLATGQEAINTSVLIGQPVMFVLLFVEVYFWIKWNKQTEEGKFVSESFKGKRTYIVFSIIGLIFVLQFILSSYLNGFETVDYLVVNNVNCYNVNDLIAQNPDWTLSQWIDSYNTGTIVLESETLDWTFRPFYVFIDVLGSILYTAAALLMAFGNILCFPFFFLSDLTWLYWSIKDLAAESVLMKMFAISTLIEVIAYTSLAITGFIQWFTDDYEIKRKEGRILVS